MNARELTDALETLTAARPVTVIGAAVIDVIADAYASRGAAVISNCNSRASISAAAR